MVTFLLRNLNEATPDFVVKNTELLYGEIRFTKLAPVIPWNLELGNLRWHKGDPNGSCPAHAFLRSKFEIWFENGTADIFFKGLLGQTQNIMSGDFQKRDTQFPFAQSVLPPSSDQSQR